MDNQTRQTRKMESFGILADGIAHEFNNLIGTIIGCTELSQMDAEEGSDLNRNLAEIHKAGIRARELVKQILVFSRKSDPGQMPLQPGIMVKETLKIQRPMLPSIIELHHNIQKDSGMVLADPAQLQQILINLCANAARAMHE